MKNIVYFDSKFVNLDKLFSCVTCLNKKEKILIPLNYILELLVN